jgi:outer membrane protein TolC
MCKRYRFFVVWLMLVAPVGMKGQVDSLENYLRVAAENNAGVRAAFLSYRAALEKGAQAGAWTDPELEMGFFFRPMELVEGRQVAEFRLMQMFPWFGTRKAARTEAQHMAQMAFEAFREVRDQLLLDVSTRWFGLCKLRLQLVNREEHREWLLQLEALALRRFASPAGGAPGGGGVSSGEGEGMPAGGQKSVASGGMAGMGGMAVAPASGTEVLRSGDGMGAMGGASGGMVSASSGMAEVLNIRMEREEMEDAMENLRAELVAEKALFNALLGRPAGSEVVVPDSLGMLPVAWDTVSAREALAERHPMLKMLEEETAAYRAQGVMERKMSYPMWGVGVQYMLIRKSGTGTEPMGMDEGGHSASGVQGMSGMDMWMPMVSVSIPVFRGKYRAKQREVSFLAAAGSEKYANTLRLLEAELLRVEMEGARAMRRIDLYRRQVVYAQTLYNLALRAFTAGQNNLEEVIGAQRRLLDYRLQGAEAVADYHTLVANRQKLISFNEL